MSIYLWYEDNPTTKHRINNSYFIASPIKSTYFNHFNDEATGLLTEKLWIDSQQWQHITCGVHPASSGLHINDIFFKIKQPLLQANKPHPFMADVKSEMKYASTFPYAFNSWVEATLSFMTAQMPSCGWENWTLDGADVRKNETAETRSWSGE